MHQAGSFNGNRLLQLRRSLAWSLEDLSSRSGVSISHISQLEKGTRKSPSVDLVYKLCQALSISIYDLLDLPIDSQELVSESLEEWGKTQPPEVVQFLLNEKSEPYLTFAKKLQENRHSSHEVLQLVTNFMQDIRKENLQDSKGQP